VSGQQLVERRQQERIARSEGRGPSQYAAVPEPETGFFGDITSGFGTGFVETGEMAALGAATLLGEENELVAREKIQSVADAIKPNVREGDKDDIAFKIGSTFGSIAGFAAPIAGVAAAAPAAIPAAAVGTGIGALLGVGTAAGEASERARAAGATEEQRNLAIRQAAPAGLLEVAPLGRFMRSVDIPVIGQFIKDLGPETVETIGQRIQNAAITGGGEAAQEVTSEIVQNLAERGYNPERAILEGTGESALYGGGAGATIQFLVDAFTNSRKAGPQGEPQLQLEGETRLQITDQREPAQVAPPEGIAGLLEPPRVALPAPAKQLPAPRTEVTPEGQAVTPEQRSAQLEQERLDEAELNRMLAEDEPIVADMPSRGVREGQARLRAEEARAVEPVQAVEAAPTPEDSEDIAAELARLDAREVATKMKRAQDRPIEEAEARRADTLSSVLSGTATASQVNTERAFSKALADQGITRTEPTKEERAAIARKTYEIAAQRPEAPVEPAVEAPVEATAVVKDPEQVALEARVAPKDRPAVQPSFPGMGRKADLGVAPVQEDVAETPAVPTPVDEAFLNELGVPKSAPIRKRVLGKDFNDPEVRQQFATLAGNQNTSGAVKTNINRALGAVPEAQADLPLFPRRGAKPATGITPLNEPFMPSVDLGKTLEVSNVPSQEVKPRTGGSGVPTPSGDVGAGRAGRVPSPTTAIETAAEPTAPA
jgi:hypothetical protein